MSKATSQVERRLSAIMFTDMVGYTAMAQKNETLAVELLEEHRAILRPIFLKYNGEVIDTVGDGFFVEFASSIDSVNCAVEIQTHFNETNAQRQEDKKILLRVGIHLGDVIHKEGRVMGDAVNVASRINPLATPGGICVTQQVFDNVRNKVNVVITPIGIHELKHVELPVNIYEIILPWEETKIGKHPNPGQFEIPGGEEIDIKKSEFHSGINSLDEILSGGYPGGSTILIIGPPGIGKELLIYQFIISGLSQNDFSFYITKRTVSEVLHDSRAFGFDADLAKVSLWMANSGGQLKFDIDDITNLSLMVKEVVKKEDGKRIRIAIDALSSILMLNPSETIYRFLAHLFAGIKERDLVLLATLEEGMHSAQVFSAMAELFDGVMELKLYEEGFKIIPTLRIKKIRGLTPQPTYYNFTYSRAIGLEISPYDG